MSDNDYSRAEKIVQQMAIPPRPQVLITLREETAKRSSNINNIIDAISKDVSLSSAVLQIANSPAFGLRNKIASIHQAVTRLGLGRVERLVTTVAMRAAVSRDLPLESFWDSASEIAFLCTKIAPQVSGISPDDAYMAGLFHDCGIPLLMMQFENYQHTLQEQKHEQHIPCTQIEDEIFEINHSIVGYLLCEKWFLPYQIGVAVLYHHDYFIQPNGTGVHNSANCDIGTLIAILKIAEYIHASIHKFIHDEENIEWQHIRASVLNYLELTDEEFIALKNEMVEVLEAC